MNLNIRHLCLFTAILLAVREPSVGAETADSLHAKSKLAAVRARIATLTDRLSGELKARDAEEARLREADLAITAARRRLENLRSAARQAEQRRAALLAERSVVRNELAAERSALAAEVRAAYINGREDRIKLMLNQDDPARAGRMAAYYGYFLRQRSQRIADVDRHLAALADLEAQLDQSSANVQALQTDTTREMESLRHERGERAASLAAVNREVSDGSQELDRLQHEEHAEETLVADLAEVMQDFPVDAEQSFGSLRGRLAWPVQGRLSARHDEARHGAGVGLMRNGVFIATKRGAKIRAPYFGRVVYADWLQGMGLLLIIGHSGNYMTLYGNAEVLYKSVGDMVVPGDVIAAVGDSGAADPQLYFEIREGRKTVNPKDWLKPVP